MNRRHDVLFYVPTVGPMLVPGDLPAGGTETQIVVLARELARRGARVAFVVHDADLPPAIDGIDLIHQRPNQARLAPARAVEAVLRTVRAVVQARAPVVVNQNAAATTGLVGFAARVTRRRFVYSSAHVFDFDFERLEPSRLRVRLFRLGIRLAHDLVVQNFEQVELARQRFNRDPVLIWSLAESAEPRRGTPDAFLWIGRLATYKRPHEFLDLAAAVPEASFRMVGVPSGPDGPRLAAEVAERAQSLANVELLEPRPRSELEPLYDHAVAVVNTSEYEGLSNIFLEAWARGVPALALHHDPDGNIERDGLGAFAGDDPAVLADHARRLWATRSDQRDLAARCIHFVRSRHSLDAVAQAWEELCVGRVGRAG